MSKETTASNHRLRLIRSVTAVGAASALLFSLSACSEGADGAVQPSASAAVVDNTIKGTGVKIDTPNGRYEKVGFDSNAPIYKLDPSDGIDHVLEAGWTQEELLSGRKFAMDYVVSEFLDSTALEGGDPSYQNWYVNEAPKYFAQETYDQIGDGTGNVVLGSFGANKNTLVPELIKDGGPRINDLVIEHKGYTPTATEDGTKAIFYIVAFNGDYRISDASAASLVSDYTIRNLPAEKHLTPEQFLASDMAKPNVKDGVGENKLAVSMGLVKNAEGAWEIISFSGYPTTSTDDFTQNDEEYFKAPA